MGVHGPTFNAVPIGNALNKGLGMAAQPQAEQDAFLAAHPDLYECSHGAVRRRIGGGRIALGSLQCPGFASGAMPDFSVMTRLA